MLVIGRKRNEKLIIGGNIEITILKVGRNHVKFGVTAPREIPIETRTIGPESSEIPRPERTELVGRPSRRTAARSAEGRLPAPADASHPSSGVSSASGNE